MLITDWVKRKLAPPAPVVKPLGVFSTDVDLSFVTDNKDQSFARAIRPSFQQPPPPVSRRSGTMDGLSPSVPLASNAPLSLVSWYGSQSFIGYQLCALMAQQWLIKRCCWMPARDAVRKGYDVTVNDGTKLDKKVLDAIRIADKKMKINQNMREFIDQGRVFGIRVVIFNVESDDPDYYLKPFNIDGVKPGSYKGISQIDPYWITPELDFDASGNPASMHFYEPTWWRVNGKRMHRTHLVIFRTEQVPDILKPTYFYGGVPMPQKIYERVYAAERTANEAPLLAMTKRLISMKLDLSQAGMKGAELQQKIQQWTQLMTNYGVKLVGLNEEVQQLETSLADLDAVIMSQYQLVAAASGVPVTKLLGTAPKGFDATGEYDESNYHEDLESLQTDDLSPFLERHHLLLIKSHIAPRFGIQPFATSIAWKPLDSMTAQELAVVNKTKIEGAVLAADAGFISQDEARGILVEDPMSGYSGLSGSAPDPEPEENPVDDPEDT